MFGYAVAWNVADRGWASSLVVLAVAAGALVVVLAVGDRRRDRRVVLTVADIRPFTDQLSALAHSLRAQHSYAAPAVEDMGREAVNLERRLRGMPPIPRPPRRVQPSRELQWVTVDGVKRQFHVKPKGEPDGVAD